MALCLQLSLEEPGANLGAFWLQIVDTQTGQVLPQTISLPGCGTASLARVAASGILIATCFGSNDVRFINPQTRQVEGHVDVPGAPAFFGKPGGIAGSALAPDGSTLDVVTDTFQVAVVDIGKRSIASVADLGRRTVRAENESLVTLSPDGTRLIVSEDVQGQPGTDIASTVHIYDTHTWREVRTIQVAQLLHMHRPPLRRTGSPST